MKKLMLVASMVILGGCALSKSPPYTPPNNAGDPAQLNKPVQTPVVLHACTAADVPVLTAAMNQVNALVVQAGTSVDEAQVNKADTVKLKAAVVAADKAFTDAQAVCTAENVQIDITNCADQDVMNTFVGFKAACDQVK